MFIANYLDELKLELLYDAYDNTYIESLDEENFLKVYKVFQKYNFYFIDDIILNYLEIFELHPSGVESEILELKKSLGENFVNIIGKDMRYLENILEVE